MKLIVKREEFKASEILVVFLSYTDRGKFEAKFKEYQTQVPTNSQSHLIL